MFPIQADIFEVGTKWQTEVKSQGNDCCHASYILLVDKIIFIFSGDPIYIRTHGTSNKSEHFSRYVIDANLLARIERSQLT